MLPIPPKHRRVFVELADPLVNSNATVVANIVALVCDRGQARQAKFACCEQAYRSTYESSECVITCSVPLATNAPA